MLIVSGMYFSCGFHPEMLKTTPWGPVYDEFVFCKKLGIRFFVVPHQYPLPFACHLLPIAYCLLPTTYYLLPTTYYLLPTTYYRLPTTTYYYYYY